MISEGIEIPHSFMNGTFVLNEAILDTRENYISVIASPQIKVENLRRK